MRKVAKNKIEPIEEVTECSPINLNDIKEILNRYKGSHNNGKWFTFEDKNKNN